MIAGNPNTLYSLAIFNDSDYEVNLRDYPKAEGFNPPSSSNSSAPGPPFPFGNVYAHNEALVLFLCMPPPAKYVGYTAYVTGRIMINDTNLRTSDGKIYTQ